MKKIDLLFFLLTNIGLSQIYMNNFTDWTSIPVYGNYAYARSLNFGKGEIGFATSNFCIWGEPTDTLSYDTRTVDLFGRVGIGKNFEIEWRYSFPKAGRLTIKKEIFDNFITITPVIGIGYMKCSMKEDTSLDTKKWAGEKFARTYYLFDTYTEIRIEKKFNSYISLLSGVKYIYSFYYEENKIDQYETYVIGGFLGLSIGTEHFSFIPEVNHYYGHTQYEYKYEPTFEKPIDFKVMNFGMGFVYRP